MSPANLRTPANIANALTLAQSRYFKVDVSKLAMLAPPWSPSSLAVLDVWSRALMGHPFVRIEGCAMGQVLHGSASHFRSDCIIAAGEWRIDADRPVRSLERARHPDAAGQAVAPHDGEAHHRGEILLRAACDARRRCTDPHRACRKDTSLSTFKKRKAKNIKTIFLTEWGEWTCSEA